MTMANAAYDSKLVFIVQAEVRRDELQRMKPTITEELVMGISDDILLSL